MGVAEADRTCPLPWYQAQPSRELTDHAHAYACQEEYGFAFVAGVPPTPEATEALVRRIAFIRETHYGSFWDFTADLAHGDLAYSDVLLRAHTDTTYFTDVSWPPVHPPRTKHPRGVVSH